jgi:spore germination protein GerM
MSKSRKSNSETLISLIILLLIAVTVAGYFWNMKRQSRRQIAPPAVSNATPNRETAAAKEIPVKVYFLAIISGQQRLKPADFQIPGAASATEALSLLLNHEPPAGCQSPLPRGTTLLRASINDGLATADFSRELVEHFSGGSDNEGAAVFSIVNTLCSLPGVKQVQILVEGKTLDSLGGHLDISAPLSYDGELVVAGR